MQPNPNDPIVWTIHEGITFVKSLEERLLHEFWHVGLTGGVLYRDKSTKDLDIILYPHSRGDCKSPNQIRTFLVGFGVTGLKYRDHSNYNDNKEIYNGTYQGKSIDFFFLS